MSLSTQNMILFDRALNYELEGVDEFLKNDLGDSDKIFLLMRPETEFLVQNIFRKLYRNKCSKALLLKTLKKKNNEYKSLKEKSGFDNLDIAEVQSEDLYGMDHVNFEWTKQMIEVSYIMENASKIQARWKGKKLRSKLISDGIITITQKKKDWSSVKQSLKDEGFSDSSIQTFYNESYLPKGNSKRSKRSKKSKNNRKRNTRKRSNRRFS